MAEAAGGAAGAGGASGGSAAGGVGGGGSAAGTGAGGTTGSQNTGTTGAGGAAPAGTSGSSGAAGSNAAAPDWTTGLDDGLKGYVQNKGWRGTPDLLQSYQNMEKLLGVPQDQLIRLPKEDDAQGWESVHTRLGRPATPDGYKLQATKDPGSPEFVKWASEQFHKNGLSEKQAQSLVEGWNAHTATLREAQTQAYNQKIAEEQGTLKKEWGAAYDQNLSIAKRAAREFGVAPEVIDGIEKSAGFASTMKLFQAIGSKLGDASFVSGGPSVNGNGPLTPVQAQDQIKALKADPGFVQKYVSGDAGAREKMERLHRFAYPDA